MGLEQVEASSGKKRGVVIPAEGAYDPKAYTDLKVPPELDNVFQYIMKWEPFRWYQLCNGLM